MTDDSTVVCIHGFPTSSYDWIKVNINLCMLVNFS